jgi:hypothetical protein
MTTMAFRASLEVTDHSRSEEIASRLFGWLRVQDLASKLDPIERETLESPYGTLHKSQLTDATLASEGASICSWAVAKASPPPESEPSDASELVTTWSILRDARESITNATLRPWEEIRTWCANVLLIRSELQQIRVDDESVKTKLAHIRDNTMDQLGLFAGSETRSRCRHFAATLPPEKRREVGGIYFVREVACSWLFDGRSQYFESE